MKKLLTIFMTIFFVNMGISCVSAEAEPVKIPGGNSLERITALGMLTGQISEKNVTRGEFAHMVSNMLKLSAVKYESETGMFKDIAKEDEIYGAAVLLASGGVIDTGYFEPDRPVTYSEAAKMVAAGLGYTPEANAKGGYPSGYIVTVQSRNIIKKAHVKRADAFLAAEEAADIISDAMTAPLMVSKNYGTNPEYTADKDRTALSEYHGISYTDAVIETIGDTAIADSRGVREERIKADGILYDVDGGVPNGFLGCRARIYYKTESDDVKEAVYAEIKDGQNFMLEITEDMIDSASGSSLLYEGENGRRKSIGLNGLKLVLNGRPTDLAEADIADADAVRFIDNNGDLNYDVALIDRKDTYFVKMFNSDERRIYDKYGNSSVCIDNAADDTTVYITDRTGNPTDYYAIKENTVVRVAASADNKRFEAVVSDVVKTGVLNGVSDDDEITADGISYKVSKHAAVRAKLGELSVGKKYDFYLDDLNRVAGFKISSDEIYGYVLRGAVKNGLADVCELKVLTAKNKFEVYKTAASVRFDGTVLKSGEKIVSAFGTDSNGRFLRQPVRYKLNENNEITYIDTEKRGASEDVNAEDGFGCDTLTRYAEFQGGKFIKDPLVFGSIKFGAEDYTQHPIKVTKKTPVFCVPPLTADDETAADEINYYATNAMYFDNFKDYNKNAATGTGIEAYDLTRERLAGMLVYYTNDVSAEPIKDTTPITVFEKITYAADRDGEPQRYLNGWQTGNYIQIPIRDGFEFTKRYKTETGEVESTVKLGDIIRCGIDSEGKINDYEKVFSLRDEDDPKYVLRYNETDSKEAPQKNPSLIAVSTDSYSANGHMNPVVWNTSEEFTARYRVVFGTLAERNGSHIVVEVPKEDGTSSILVSDVQKYNAIKIDEEKERIYMPDLAEFMPKSAVGDGASRVIIYMEKGTPKTVVLVKRK